MEKKIEKNNIKKTAGKKIRISKHNMRERQMWKKREMGEWKEKWNPQIFDNLKMKKKKMIKQQLNKQYRYL